MYRVLLVVSGVLALAAAGHADITIPGADGSDGAFNPTTNVEVDLSLAPTGTWNGTNQAPGLGVYDPAKRAVVFRYSSVTVPNGVTVTFKNHPSRAPLVWLVSGNVTINGTVNLNGKNGHPDTGFVAYAEPGPGGFRGARGWRLVAPNSSSGGLGPGGSSIANAGSTYYFPAGASHGTAGSPGMTGAPPPGPTYGDTTVLSLLGGSGGGGARYVDTQYNTGGGGGGGGAILIAAAQTITIGGSINASGGNGSTWAVGGSGGAVRLIGDAVTGAGNILARAGSSNGGGTSGKGRIRFEANNFGLTGTVDPSASTGVPAPIVLWADELQAPTVKITQIAGQNVPADPRAGLDWPQQDALISIADPVIVRLACTNVPLNWNVKLRLVPKTGGDRTVPATFVTGNQASSVWEAQVTFPLNDFAVVQARASDPNNP